MENKEKTYMVVDLKDGSVTYLSDVPTGGWTDEYKTEKLVLRYIPAGTFMMGSPEDEYRRTDLETLHKVELTRPFYIGVFQITQKQYELINGKHVSNFEGNTRPVEMVSYDMIRGKDKGSKWPLHNEIDEDSFLAALRAKVKLDFDLPTEAQWEYACRAGTTTALNNGESLSLNQIHNMDKVGRTLQNGFIYNDNKNEKRFLGTANVGSFSPNNWGLYDMHGNVCEWCLDWIGYYICNDDDNSKENHFTIDPKGPEKGKCRVMRGGCFDHMNEHCRSASRHYRYPNDSGSADGFRIVFVL